VIYVLVNNVTIYIYRMNEQATFSIQFKKFRDYEASGDQTNQVSHSWAKFMVK